jgi:hypothetical protein
MNLKLMKAAISKHTASLRFLRDLVFLQTMTDPTGRQLLLHAVLA